jgi:hypothetical protein
MAGILHATGESSLLDMNSTYHSPLNVSWIHDCLRTFESHG